MANLTAVFCKKKKKTSCWSDEECPIVQCRCDTQQLFMAQPSETLLFAKGDHILFLEHGLTQVCSENLQFEVNTFFFFFFPPGGQTRIKGIFITLLSDLTSRFSDMPRCVQLTQLLCVRQQVMQSSKAFSKLPPPPLFFYPLSPHVTPPPVSLCKPPFSIRSLTY